MLLIFFFSRIIIKVTEQIVNSTIDFAANFEVLKKESKCDRKITKWGAVVNNMQKIQQYLNPLF